MLKNIESFVKDNIKVNRLVYGYTKNEEYCAQALTELDEHPGGCASAERRYDGGDGKRVRGGRSRNLCPRALCSRPSAHPGAAVQ